MYYEFHHVAGHSTVNYRILGLKLATKLVEGKLGDKISVKNFEMDVDIDKPDRTNGDNPKRGRRDDEPPLHKPRQWINMIIG